MFVKTYSNVTNNVMYVFEFRVNQNKSKTPLKIIEFKTGKILFKFKSR